MLSHLAYLFYGLEHVERVERDGVRHADSTPLPPHANRPRVWVSVGVTATGTPGDRPSRQSSSCAHVFGLTCTPRVIGAYTISPTSLNMFTIAVGCRRETTNYSRGSPPEKRQQPKNRNSRAIRRPHACSPDARCPPLTLLDTDQRADPTPRTRIKKHAPHHLVPITVSKEDNNPFCERD